MYRGRTGGGGGFNMARNNRNRNKNRSIDAREIINASTSFIQHDDRFDDSTGRHQQQSRFSRFNNRSRGKGFRSSDTNASNFQRSSNGPTDDSFKVVIPQGGRFPKNEILTILKEALGPEANIPFYCVGKEKGNTVFYVLGSDAAATIRNLSRRVNARNGQTLTIQTQRASMPITNVDQSTMDTIKAAMSRLYDPNMKIMNLSNFRDAFEFKECGLFINLGRPNILKKVIDIIVESTPNILALNLSDNKISILEPLSLLATKCTDMKALDLSKNKISRKEELERLRGLDLLELILEGNPLLNVTRFQPTYISTVRRLFKNLKKLDSEDLPPEIGFDVSTTTKLPPEVGCFFPNEEVKAFVYKFLEAYYQIYDSNNRKDLIQAYHNAAVFTYSVAHLGSAKQNSYKLGGQANFLSNSHNLLRIVDESDYVTMVKTSNVDIVAQLCRLPNTKHQPDSFKIDIPLFNSNFVMIVLNGLFLENYKSNSPMRSFVRTFLIVPHNEGWVIINDMLHFTNPSHAQMAKYREVVTKEEMAASPKNSIGFNPSSTINTDFTGQASTSSNFITTPPTVVANPQEEIVLKFMEVTKMNRAFSLRCLEENNFNPEVAFQIFLQLQNSNALPPEAFVH